MKRISPTQLSLRQLRMSGYTAQVVERWIPQARKRVDLFGCIDVLAIKANKILGIQATSRGHVNDHIEKIKNTPGAVSWLESGGRLQLWGWSKKGARGKRKLWSLHPVSIYLGKGGEIQTRVMEL